MNKPMLFAMAARRRRSGFTPPDLANLILWLDATKITGLANNDPVTTWASDARSLVPAGVTQTGAASLKPTYKTDQQNGLPALSFDGGDYLINDAVSSYFDGTDMPYTALAVLKRSGTAESFIVGAADATAANIHSMISYRTALNAQIAVRGTESADTRSEAAYGAGTNMHILSTRTTGTVGSMWVNNGLLSNSLNTNVTAIDCSRFTIGALRYSTPLGIFTGLICEVLLYKSAISDANLLALHTYLSAKWGIALA